MNKLFTKLIIAAILLFAAPIAFAQSTPLQVTFTPNPLFDQSNFLPGDDSVGTVDVVNNTESEQEVVVEAINVSDHDSFGAKLHLNITGSAGVIYNDNFEAFLTNGPVTLALLPSETAGNFVFTVSFVDDNDNTYQGKTLGFDLCVGFEGGVFNCGETVVGEEEGTIGSGNSSSTSGGGSSSRTSSGGSLTLQISNEQVTAVNVATGNAVVEWDTNIFATSQVVYGPLSGTYNLNMETEPFYGYPSGSAENPLKVLHHSVTLTDLVPGQVYKYRVISRASPPTVSYERVFAFALGSTATAGSGQDTSTRSSVVVASVDNNEPPVIPDNFTEINTMVGDLTLLDAPSPDPSSNNFNQVAATIFGMPGWMLPIGIILLILLIIYFLWILFKQKDVVR